ncbi:MAG: hypothetical protein ACJA1Z_000605 [Patiriisocius sp.]|jgi:hypothetical protein
MLKITYIFLFLFLFSFDCFANSMNFIICPKGKVKHGDTYEKFIDYCGKGISFSGGARTLGKKNTIMTFKTFIKKYPDGSKIRVLFLDGKVAFLFDL